MLPVLLVDLLFVGASVYLLIQGELMAGVVMLLMGMLATGVLVVRLVSRGEGSPRRGFGSSPLGAGGRLRPEEVVLEPELVAEVRELARRGQKIAAINRVRELSGASLKAAKDFVEGLG